MARLQWTRDRTFVDWSRNFKAVGSGEYDVPADAIEEYLENAGWDRLNDENGDSEDTEGSANSTDRESERRLSDAEELSEEHWKSALSEIESGGADSYLDELEEVDERSSVQKAIADRRQELE